MFYFLFSQGNISMNIVFCESPGIDASPFSLHPVPCPARFPSTISPLPTYP